MSPQDIRFFEAMALLCTLSFMAMVFFILRFLQGLLTARTRLIGLVAEAMRSLDPILAELQAGVAEFRAAGEHIHHSASQVADLGDRLSDWTSRTQKGVRAVWAVLAQNSSAHPRTQHRRMP